MNSIESRLLARVLTAVVLALTLAGILVFGATRVFLRRNFDASLAARLGALEGLTQQEPHGILMEPADEFMREYNASNAVVFFQIWVKDDQVLKKSPGLRETSLPRPPISGEHIHFWTLRLPNGNRARAAGERFVPQVDDDVSPAERPAHPEDQFATAVVAMETRAMNRTLALFGATLGCAAAVAFVVVLAVVRRSVKQEVRPLAQLAEFTAGIHIDSLGARFPADDLPVELKPIATRINDLLHRLAEAFEHERQFTDDAAHELRTPLAELRSLTEVALKWPPDAPDTAAMFRDLHAVVLRMESLTNGLLLIARCERGRMPVHRTSLRVADAVAAAWKTYAPVAQTRGLRTAMAVDGATLSTDAVLFDTVLRNLMGNATAYTPGDGRINITAHARPAGDGELCIANDSLGLTPEDAAQMGKRFWRKDAARAGVDHAGLGLSVVTTLCGVLGLRVTFRTETNRFEAWINWDSSNPS